MTDEALMAAYVQGDAVAFEQLFTRLAPRLHGFFRRCFHDASVADDLLQLTFMKIHRARDQYRPELRVAPWMFTVAARVRLDELRRRRRLPEDCDEEAVARAEDPAEPFSADANDRAEAVRAALAALPESQRAVIHLHRYEGLTFAEIAKAFGTTEGAVKLRAFRGYERLRASLQKLVQP